MYIPGGMNFRQIEAFRAIMMNGSVTQAAKQLSISQPAVSRLWSDLEKEVGFPLFSRLGRSLVPTAEARAFCADVDRAFVGLKDIQVAAEAIRDYRVGTLNLVAMPSLASRLMPELIGAFDRKHKDIGIWLEVLPRSGVISEVRSGRYDVGVATGPVVDDAIRSTRLCCAEAYCVMPPGHRLAKRTVVRVEDLGGERLIALPREVLFRHFVDRKFEAAGVEHRPHIQARTADAIYGLVAAGLGLSIVGPDIPAVLKSRRLVFKPLSPPFTMDIELLIPHQGGPSRLAKLFSKVAIRHASRVAKRPGENTRAA